MSTVSYKEAGVDIDAAVVEFANQRAEKAEVPVRGASERGRVHRRMGVRGVRTHRHVNRHGNRLPPGFVKQARQPEAGIGDLLPPRA